MAANRVAAINPPVDDTDPIRKFSIDPEATRTYKTQQNSLQKRSRYGHDCGRRFADTTLIFYSLVFWISLVFSYQGNQERKFSPKRKFSAGHPGYPAKNFGQPLQILEKQAFRNGHPARTSMKKLRSEKLWADFSFPRKFLGVWSFSKGNNSLVFWEVFLGFYQKTKECKIRAFPRLL